MTILVTGATGHIGRHLVADLLERGASVRALTREPDTAALPDTVAVRRGDLAGVPGDVFDDVEAVFLFPAQNGVASFVDRAVAAGVSRFVVLSSLSVSERHGRDAGSVTQRHHRAVEDAVTARTDAWTMLRPGAFATNLLLWSFPIRSGLPLRIPYPTSSQVLIHAADVAAAAATALTGSGHTGRTYELTGPESLTKVEQLAAISAAIGREVPFVEISAEEFREDVGHHVPDGIVSMLLEYWKETVDDPEVPLPSPLELPRRTLTQWALDHREAFTA
jgi:uncharacterized protein YbjT (DUF2867 family)